MKFWLKFLVALSVVVIVAFGVWAFFFREKDEVLAYNRTCEIVDYKESLGTKEKISDLQDLNYIGKDSGKVITASNDTNKEILNLREIMFSNSIITKYDEGGTIICYFDSYCIMESYLDEITIQLIPYLKNVNASDASIKTLKNTISTYTKNLQELNQALENLTTCQNSIEGTEIEMTTLYGNYNSVRIKYRRCLNNGATLVTNIFDIIKSSVGDIKFDTKLALMDSFARSLIVVTREKQETTESYYAYDLHLILERYQKVCNGQNIFTAEYDEYNFLMSYNKLFNNYLSEYTKALNKQNINKKKMADGQDLSDIKQEAQESLIFVLNVLGY